MCFGAKLADGMHEATMQVYKSKYGRLPGTDYTEATSAARQEYQIIQRRNPRRQPYVRSKYFNGDKVFINIFWNHLAQKRKGEQMKRVKLLAAAIDLLRNTTEPPETIFSKSNLNELLHRFAGQTKDGLLSYVQVKKTRKATAKTLCRFFKEVSLLNKKASRWVA